VDIRDVVGDLDGVAAVADADLVLDRRFFLSKKRESEECERKRKARGKEKFEIRASIAISAVSFVASDTPSLHL